MPGPKVVVGDEPARSDSPRRYPDVHFLGAAQGRALADLYQTADAFVFPSRTDTFGLGMLEALAAGAPVAAFPVDGPREVLGSSRCGVLNKDLRAAALAALAVPRDRCREYGARYSMRESARNFLEHVSEAIGVGLDRRRLRGSPSGVL